MTESQEGFDIAGLRQAVQNHWQHHGDCRHLNWSVFQRDDEVWQIEVAPIFQEVYGSEDDGKKVWTGFEFSLKDFLNEPGVDVEDFGAASFCIDCNPTPIIAVRGRYQGVPFVMKLHLEPVPNTDPVEIIDKIRNEVRAIKGDAP